VSAPTATSTVDKTLENEGGGGGNE
jgi:hypothetical protein